MQWHHCIFKTIKTHNLQQSFAATKKRNFPSPFAVWTQQDSNNSFFFIFIFLKFGNLLICQHFSLPVKLELEAKSTSICLC